METKLGGSLTFMVLQISISELFFHNRIVLYWKFKKFRVDFYSMPNYGMFW